MKIEFRSSDKSRRPTAELAIRSLQLLLPDRENLGEVLVNCLNTTRLRQAINGKVDLHGHCNSHLKAVTGAPVCAFAHLCPDGRGSGAKRCSSREQWS